MKRISTLFVSFCFLASFQTIVAQSVTINTAAPGSISPALGLALAVSDPNGFSSTSTGTFNEFATNKTTEIVSPEYHYANPQSTIYFKYNVTIAQAGGTTYVSDPIVKIIYNGTSIAAHAAPLTVPNGTTDYYFAVTPFLAPAQFPANTTFRISITMSIPQGDRTIRANSLSTNALLGSAGASLPLPVKFSSFEAKAVLEGVDLNWTVGMEDQVKGYEVEKSTDEKNFSTISFVPASGQSSYSFMDEQPAAVAYYRIKSVDLDGKAGYSAIVSVKSGQSSVVLRAFPTPVRKDLTIQHNAATVSTRITISSIDGRLIQSIMPVAGSQQTTVDLSAARAGLYIVRFDTGNGGVETLKVMKQ